jgi:uncharacterized C2H2 Zn-finger protein
MATLWKCPACDRTFGKKNQWHSCVSHTVESHFRGKNPKLKQIYERLFIWLEDLGPIHVDVAKSSINLAGKHHFGGVTVRKDYIRLGFLSDEMIQDARIVRTERIGHNRIGHSVILRAPEDVDDQVMSWLKHAYRLQSR